MSTPESVVLAFIADYKEWSDHASEILRRNPSPEAMEQADTDYELLLTHYCPPGVNRKAAAVSSPSSHDPERERVLRVTTEGVRSVVSTELLDQSGFTDVYEYSLLHSDGRWLIEGIDYIDEEGKWPHL
jgi:hypothetical protein